MIPPRSHPARLAWSWIGTGCLCVVVLASAGRAQPAPDGTHATPAQLEERLAEVYRRLYVRTAPEDRPALLVELMSSGEASLRRLGFDLANREALSARSLGNEVIDRAIRALDDPEPAIRLEAATLLAGLGAEGAGVAALDALRREQDPATAAAMLLVIAQHPVEGAAETVLARLESLGPPEVLAASMEAMLALHGGVPLDDPVLRDRAAAAIRRTVPDRITGAGVQLLAALGAREEMLGLLSALRPAIARVAGDALVSDPAALDVLLAAARTRPALFDAACAAIRAHRRSAAGFGAIATLAGSPEARRSAEVELAGVLPIDVLEELAGSIGDPARREAVLAVLVRPEAIAKLREPAEADRRIPLVARLARDRLALGRTAAALRCVQAVGDVLADGDTRLDAERVLALVLLDREPEADRIALAPRRRIDVWLDAAELLAPTDPTRASAALARLDAGFDGQLTAAQLARREAIAAALTAEDPPSRRSPTTNGTDGRN